MHQKIFVYSINSHLALCLSLNGSKQEVLSFFKTLPSFKLLTTARLKINVVIQNQNIL
jgi:hypothetical protein|tara:strand:- start:191 stop:364 length:174 start_codon:yes stop_codon:yes gene_type:complete